MRVIRRERPGTLRRLRCVAQPTEGLDEPTEVIHPSIVEEIEALVQALRARRATTILLVARFLDVAVAVADRYDVTEGGTIVARGVGVALADHTLRQHLAV